MGTSVEHTLGLETSALGMRPRKRRSSQEKLQIVQETLHAQDSVAVIARRHGVNANQVFAWRRQYQRGELLEGSKVRDKEAVIVPVQIAEPPRSAASARTTEATSQPSAGPRIEIELAQGPRVKIWDINSETLRALIRDLMRPC